MGRLQAIIQNTKAIFTLPAVWMILLVLYPLTGKLIFYLLNMSIFIIALNFLIKPGRLQELNIRPIHLVWVVLIVHPVFIYGKTVLGPSQGIEYLTTQMIVLLTVWLLCGLYAFFHVLRNPKSLSPLFKGRLRWLLLYTIVALISTLYSPNPLLTLGWTFKLIVALGLLSIILHRARDFKDAKRIMDATYMALALVVIVVWIGVVTIPDDAIHFKKDGTFYRLGGEMIHPILLAFVSAVLASVSLVRGLTSQAKNRKWFYLTTFGFMSITMLATVGRAGIFSGVLTFILILVLLGRRKGLIMISAAGVIALFSPPVFNLIKDYLMRGQSIDLIMTASNRIPVWEAIIGYIKVSPLWGHGYVAATRVDFAPNTWSPLHAHNAFLEILAGTGLIGLVPFLIVFLGAWTWCLKTAFNKDTQNTTQYPFFVEMLAVLLILTIVSVFDKGIGGLVTYEALVFFAVVTTIQEIELLNFNHPQ